MPEPRPTHIRSAPRIFLFVPAGIFLLLMPGLGLVLSGVVGLLTGEGGAAAPTLALGLGLLLGLVVLIRWAVRPIPVNPDGSVGRWFKVYYPELREHEALEASDLLGGEFGGEVEAPEVEAPEGVAPESTGSPNPAAPASHASSVPAPSAHAPGAPPAAPAPGTLPAAASSPGRSDVRRPLVLQPDRGRTPPGVLLALGLVWLAAGALFLLLASGMAAPDPLPRDFLLAALAFIVLPGVGLLFAWRFTARRRARWGACTVELPEGPGVPGSPLRVRVVLPHSPRSVREIRASLVNLEQRIRRRSGEAAQYAQVWEETQRVEPDGWGESTRVEFTYRIPAHARPSSRTRGSRSSLWRLEISTHEPVSGARTLPGVLPFVVPVVAVRTVLAAALLLAAGAALLPTPAEAQNPWRTTEWVTLCDPQIMIDHREDCLNDPGPPRPPTQGSTRWLFEVASEWLESLGFPEPSISRRYPDAREAPTLRFPFRSAEDPRCVFYFCARLSALEGRVAGSLDVETLQIQIRPGRAPDSTSFIELHELFHAIQYTYMEETFRLAASEWLQHPEVYLGISWFIEGTATFVEGAFAQHLAGNPLLHPDLRLRVNETERQLRNRWLRFYDQPLHFPPSLSVDMEWGMWAYGSWEFFDYLGRREVGGHPMAYLNALLPTVNTNASVDGLPGLKNHLREFEARGDSLHHVYTDFVRTRLRHPCYFSPFGAFDGDGICRPARPSEWTIDLAPGDTVARHAHRVGAMAANGYLVQTEVTEGSIGRLMVRVPPGMDASHLRLVVDDQRVDLPDASGQFAGGARNTFTTLLPPGADTFLVRLVHAPASLGDIPIGFGRPVGDPAPIEFILLEEEVAVVVTGAVNDHLEGGSYLTYGTPFADPVETARAAVPGLVERLTGHFPDTEEGRRARAEILAATSQGLDEAARARPPRAEGGQPDPCKAMITVFDDARRSLVQIAWEGAGPFLGRSHAGVHMGLSYNMDDVAYGAMKHLLQSQRIVEDPEAAAAFRGWLDGTLFTSFTRSLLETASQDVSPGDALRMRGLAGIGGRLAGAAPTEGTPLPERAMAAYGDEFSREFQGQGQLEIHRQGEMILGFVEFVGEPAHPEEEAPVRVRGVFATPVGPLLETLLSRGCEGEDEMEEPEPVRRPEPPPPPPPPPSIRAPEPDPDDPEGRPGAPGGVPTPEAEVPHPGHPHLWGIPREETPDSAVFGTPPERRTIEFLQGGSLPPGEASAESAPQGVEVIEAGGGLAAWSGAFALRFDPDEAALRSCELPPEATSALAGLREPRTGFLQLGLGLADGTFRLDFTPEGEEGLVVGVTPGPGGGARASWEAEGIRAILRSGDLELFLAPSGRSWACEGAVSVEVVVR